jgi:uncharacterized membrane protein (DUF485 family)
MHVDFSIQFKKIKKTALASSLLIMLGMPSIGWGKDSNSDVSGIGSRVQASCHIPRQGPQGVTGAVGATGPTGPVGTFDSLFVNDTAGATLALGVSIRAPFPFDGLDITTGSSITQASLTTFTISEPGVYYANFIAYPAAWLGTPITVQFEQDGLLIGAPFTFIGIVSPFSLQQAFIVTALWDRLEPTYF